MSNKYNQQNVFSFIFCFMVSAVLILGIATTQAMAAQSTVDESKQPVNTLPLASPAPGGAKGMEDAKTAYEQNLDSYDKPEASLGKSTSSSLNANFVALTCMMVGCTDTEDNKTILGSSANSGALGQTFKAMAQLYNPPATTYTYVADVFKNMGVETPIYAQGYGYSSLQTLLGLWKVFRNIAYVFFTIIFIFIGFVIMFRQKIGGQAAVTVQQALPRVILSLILVTFSYAIAGLAVDLMYLIMFLFLQFLQVSNDTERNNLINGDFGWLFARIIGGATSESWAVTTNAVGAIFGETWGFFGDILEGVLVGVGGVIFMLVVVIAAFFSAFRLLFALLTSYISFLLNVMFAPLILMTGAIPGVKTFQKWLMSLVADLSPFIVVMVLLAFQQVLATSLTGKTLTAEYNTGMVSAAEETMFVPPYIVSGGVTGTGIASIVSLGILLTLPEFVKKVKQKLGGGGGFFGDIPAALGAGLLAATRTKPLAAAKNLATGAVKSGVNRTARGTLGSIIGRTTGRERFRTGAEGTVETQQQNDAARDYNILMGGTQATYNAGLSRADATAFAQRRATSNGLTAGTAQYDAYVAQERKRAMRGAERNMTAASAASSKLAFRGSSVKARFEDWSSRNKYSQQYANDTLELKNQITRAIAQGDIGSPSTQSSIASWLALYAPGVSTSGNFATAKGELNWGNTQELRAKQQAWVNGQKPSWNIFK